MKTVLWILLTAFCLLLPSDGHPAQAAQGSAEQATKTPAPLDINRATAADFATLPGIGPELARRIVAFRAKHGPFRRVEDLLVIRGVGRKKWRAIRPYVRVGN